MREHLEQRLAERGGDWQSFSELMIRLLDYGVLCRDENKKEAELYDRYVQLESLASDYLSVLGIRLLHERRFQSVRLFPPGAEVPGLADGSDAVNTGLRERLNNQEIAAILVLRAEYDKALREGDVDENGCVLLSLEALNLAMKNLLGRTLPETTTERQVLLRRLRRLRVIRLGSEDMPDDAEAWLIIRPGITSLVTDSVLNTLVAGGNSPADTDLTDLDTRRTAGDL